MRCLVLSGWGQPHDALRGRRESARDIGIQCSNETGAEDGIDHQFRISERFGCQRLDGRVPSLGVEFRVAGQSGAGAEQRDPNGPPGVG